MHLERIGLYNLSKPTGEHFKMEKCTRYQPGCRKKLENGKDS